MNPNDMENNQALEAKVESLRRDMENFVKRTPTVNIRNLTGSFRTTSTVPTATELPEGGIILYENGADIRLYVNLNGTVRYATLT